MMDFKLGTTLIKWPSHEGLQRTMPLLSDGNHRLSRNIFIEKPSNFMAKACTRSQYKHCNTANCKVLSVLFPKLGVVMPLISL